MPNTTPKKVKLSPAMKVVVSSMKEGWVLRWEKSSHHEPFIQKRGELEEFTVPMQVCLGLCERNVIKARGTRSIIEYYELTELGKSL